ncbi:MAG TPA: septum formation initiator family protein [Terriglobales bacterium]|nr:septum formation initiator family protein [Terriglobales bacterium]
MEKLKPVLEAAWQKAYDWRRRGATLALCLVAMWVAYHVIFGANGMLIYSHKRTEHRALNKEILELKQENQQLNQRVDALKNDPQAIEKEAREQLRLARPGEVIYTLPQPARTPATVTAQKH